MSQIVEYLQQYRRYTSGYTADELLKLEKLYDIEIKGNFREFLLVAGKDARGLLNDDLVFYKNYTVRQYLRIQFGIIETLQDCQEWNLVNQKPFLLEVQAEKIYYFLLTSESDDYVYIYDEDDEFVTKTDLTFYDYIKLSIENSKTVSDSGDYQGNLLSICN